MSYADAEYLCNHLDSPTLVANLVKQVMSHYADHKHEDKSTLIHEQLIDLNLDTIRKAIKTGHIKGLDKYLPNLPDLCYVQVYHQDLQRTPQT
jgi:hypothetical protein